MSLMTASATVNVAWECNRGYDHDIEVEVEYTYDGDRELRVLSAKTLGEPHGISDYDFDELVDEATFERAVDDYPQWLWEQTYNEED
ncbi:MAG: hypothetical protein ACO3AD_18765 [Burkholderiaceae bacterium]